MMLKSAVIGLCFLILGCGGGGGDDSISGPGASSITITGVARYEDRLFDQNGLTGAMVQKPIRNALVEIVTIIGGKIIASGSTDTQGKFNLTGSNSGNPAGVFLRVISQTGASQSAKITILNNTVSKALLSAESLPIDDSVSDTISIEKNILATAAVRIGGAFNILDVLMNAGQFVQDSGANCVKQPGCIPPPLTVYWEPGSTDGTFYDNAIHVLGSNTDPDEYDDAVVIHEYGHFILSQFSKDDSPGGSHFLSEKDQDIRLSWSEGWANFFSSAVRESEIYVDTHASGNALISFNVENYSSSTHGSLSTSAIYTTNEIAVSGVLWDALDGGVGDDDNLDLKFKDIFQAVLDFPPNPATMERFWLAFEAGEPASVSDFQTILKGRKIELALDATEGGVELNLGVNGSQNHTLYQTAPDHTKDVDIIPLVVNIGTTYTVKTLNLKNGADTFLEIKDQSGILLLGGSNDNPGDAHFSSCSTSCPKNGLSNLSSSVTFNSGSHTTLNAHVSRSLIAPPSAGLFGSYEISLTSP